MDVDLQVKFRRRRANVKGVREAQTLGVKLGRSSTPRVGSIVFKVWYACQLCGRSRQVQGKRERTREFNSGRGGQKLGPSQLAGEETTCCQESGGAHVEQWGTRLMVGSNAREERRESIELLLAKR